MDFRSILEKFKGKDELLKQALEQRRVEKRVLELEKSSNERELERFIKEAREESIKKELDAFRKKRQMQYEHGNKILQIRNMFKEGHKDILKDN